MNCCCERVDEYLKKDCHHCPVHGEFPFAFHGEYAAHKVSPAKDGTASVGAYRRTIDRIRESVSGEHVCSEKNPVCADSVLRDYTCPNFKQPQPEWESHIKSLPDEVRLSLANYAAKQFLDGYEHGREEMTVNGKANYAAGRNDTLDEIIQMVSDLMPEGKVLNTGELFLEVLRRLKANRDI